jgi:hypothetical protein
MSGATALVVAMTNDGWSAARSWVGRWLSRGRPQEEGHSLARLDRDRKLLLSAPVDDQATEAERLVTAWAVRLQDVAEIDQNAALELVEWVTRRQSANLGKEQGVRQKAKASGHAQITQVGGNQTNHGGSRDRK